ncbi:hypothetical protein CF038_29140, partial [Klebsiella michiganensis]|nr:hypothetical protein [Klebsiella michiganensis]
IRNDQYLRYILICINQRCLFRYEFNSHSSVRYTSCLYCKKRVVITYQLCLSHAFHFYIFLKMPEESLIMDFATGRLIFFGALLYYIRVFTHRYL